MENTEPKQPSSPPSEASLGERGLRHLMALSRYSIEPLTESTFCNKLLEIVVAVTGAKAGVVWKISSNQAEEVADFPLEIGSIEFKQMVPFEVSADLISKVHDRGEAHYVGEIFGVSTEGWHQQVDSSCDRAASFHLLKQNAEASMVVGLIYHGKMRAIDPKKIEFALLSVREWVVNYYRSVESRSLREELKFMHSLQRFRERLASSSEPLELLYELVNEVANFVSADRVTVFRGKANRFEMVAISGVSTLSSSSEISNLLNAAVNEVAEKGLPAEVASSDEKSHFVERYFKRSNCLQMIAVPILSKSLKAHESFRGVLLFEVFGESSKISLDEKLLRIVEQVNLGLTNAFESESKVNSFRVMGKQGLLASGRRTFKFQKWIAGLVLTALIFGLFFLKTDFFIKADGQILPFEQRRIFAPGDGEIAKVFDARDDVFKKGEPLIRIRSLDLEMQIARVKGEQMATQEKLFAIESRRITGGGRAEVERENSNSALSASAEELQILLESQNAQLEILNRQLSILEVESPLDGQIVTWQFRKLLDARPVQRGQLLMTIADVNGGWIGELEVSDYRAGYVMEALQESGTLPVKFVLVSSPDQIHSGRVTSASYSTDEDQMGRPIMRATVAVDWESEVKPRSGAKIIAKIKCGKKPLIYQWFHEPVANFRSALF